jgi:predicted cupin superfamily sugar epimerase
MNCNNKEKAASWIQRLNLYEHPEGGYYRKEKSKKEKKNKKIKMRSSSLLLLLLLLVVQFQVQFIICLMEDRFQLYIG